jgi:hypothetical protein
MAIVGGLRYRWLSNEERGRIRTHPWDAQNVEQASRHAKIATVLAGLGILSVGTGIGILVFSPGEVQTSRGQPPRFLGYLSWSGKF